MFKITRTEQHGGFWNGNALVKEIETDNAEFAESYKGKEGYTVEEVSEPESELDSMNVAQLKKYAKEHGIDLGGETKKEPILAIIRATEEE